MPIIWMESLLFFGALVISFWITHYLINWLTKENIMAVPDSRSCHTENTPVGGGWVLFLLGFLAWTFFFIPQGQLADILILPAMFCLALISWVDDQKTVSILWRFAVQIIGITTVLMALPNDQLFFKDYLPLFLDRLVIGFIWLWFINLYNFMDGIDGLAAGETIFIAIGLALIAFIVDQPLPFIYVPTVIAGAAFGFLWWNWHPAKIFMGDIGSITMGFVLGWLLLSLVLEGYGVAAIILPLYFFVDASWTLLRRILQKEKFLQPHKTHFYQKAVYIQKKHNLVVSPIMTANLFLLNAAIWSLTFPITSFLIACTIVGLILLYLTYLTKEI